MRPAALLFDLDGTLIDSEDGIVDSVQHALRAMGQPAMTREAIIPLIGPPLLDTFRTMFGEESLAVQAVAEYKRHYDAAGWHLFRIYDGIEAAVRGLHAHGHRLAVATSKTERFAPAASSPSCLSAGVLPMSPAPARMAVCATRPT